MAKRSVAEAESIVYHFLTFGFKYPEAQGLEQLKAVWPIVKEVAGELGEEAGIPCPNPDVFSQALDEAAALRLDGLQVEYTRLFITGFPTTPARAVESVYREGALVGEAAEEVAQFYAEFRLESHDEFVDSIASETEFLAYLSGEELADEARLAAFAEGRSDFLRRHFLRWVPDFADDVRRHAEVPLYTALAGYLTWICKVEEARLAA